MEVFSQVHAKTLDVISKHLVELLPHIGGDLARFLLDDRAGHELAAFPPESGISPATGGHQSLITGHSTSGRNQRPWPAGLLRRLVILPVEVGTPPPIVHTDESKYLLHRLVPTPLQVVGRQNEQLVAREEFHVTIDLHGVAAGVDILGALVDGLLDRSLLVPLDDRM